MGLNVVIVEDVHDNIDTLKYLLEKSPVDINVIGIADNLKDAESVLGLPNIDIAFLDIQLKDGNIFSLLENLSNKVSISYELVFITAFSSFEMAIKAIQFACLDYITKPIAQESLDKAILKATKEINRSGQQKQLQLLLDAIKGNVDFPKSISVALPKGIIEVLNVDNIQYFQADKNTCILNLDDNKKIHSIKTFSYYLNLFNNHPDYIQISRSYFVNRNKIKRYNHRNKEITLSSGERLIVSHRMSNNVKQMLTDNVDDSGIFGSLKRLFKS
jgi:two-component system LytT family response regulator